MTDSPARAIARFAAAIRYGDIPTAVRERARVQILDGLGVGFAANAYPFADKAIAGVAALGGEGACTVVGRRERLPVRDAALANGILIHGLDFDDTHLESIVHATAACLACALSLAESLDLHGRDLLTAYVAGMEVAIRLGAAVKGGFHHAGFHATDVVSHFSAAIVAGKLLGLTEDQQQKLHSSFESEDRFKEIDVAYALSELNIPGERRAVVEKLLRSDFDDEVQGFVESAGGVDQLPENLVYSPDGSVRRPDEAAIADQLRRDELKKVLTEEQMNRYLQLEEEGRPVN